MEKIEGFLNDNLSKHSSFIQSVNKKVGVITERMQSRYETLNEKCDFYEAPEEADDLRYLFSHTKKQQEIQGHFTPSECRVKLK